MNIRTNQMLIACDYAIKWSVCAVVFALPFSKSLAECGIAISIIAWISKKILKKEMGVAYSALNLSLLFYVLACVPSLFISSYTALSLKAFITKVVKYAAFYYVIIDTVDTKEMATDILIIGFLSACVILVDGLVQYYGSGIDFLHNYPAFKMRVPWDPVGFFRGFPTASFPYPNDLAAWIVIVLFPAMAVALFDLKKSMFRVFCAALSLGLLYLVFLTKVRSVWMGMILSIVYMAVSKKMTWLFIILVIVLALPFILKMEMAQYIFQTGSLHDRMDMWKTGWEIFKQHPIIGNGVNTFFVTFMNLRQDEWKGTRGSYAHNCYLQMAADIGIVGLGAFAWVIIAYFTSVVRSLKHMTDPFYHNALWGLSIGVFVFLVQSFFDTNLYSLNLAILFWCAIALSQSIIRITGKAS